MCTVWFPFYDTQESAKTIGTLGSVVARVEGKAGTIGLLGHCGDWPSKVRRVPLEMDLPCPKPSRQLGTRCQCNVSVVALFVIIAPL